MQFNAYKTAQLTYHLSKVYRDPLVDFVLADAESDLKELQELNLRVFLEQSRMLDLDFVYFGERDLAGCQRKEFDRYPAIWILSQRLGISGCGNTDQSQINNSVYNSDRGKSYRGDGRTYIGAENIGAWNIREKRKLTLDEQFALPFKYVADRDEIEKLYEKTYPSVPRRLKSPWGYYVD